MIDDVNGTPQNNSMLRKRVLHEAISHNSEKVLVGDTVYTVSLQYVIKDNQPKTSSHKEPEYSLSINELSEILDDEGDEDY